MSHAVTPRRISDCLLAASDESLSSCLAVVHELSLFNAMWSKGADLFEKAGNRINKGTWSSESDHFRDKLEARAREFGSLSAGEKLLQAIGELQKLLGLPARDLRAPLDLSDAMDDIGMAAANTLRQDKEAHFAGSDLAGLIEHQMTTIFKGLTVRIEDLSARDQEDLVKRVREFVHSLPADQQKFIMDKLGAADLSDRAIRQAIATGTMWTAFTAAVQLFGFAFYTTAAHLLAILSLHLLPFGAYIGLSSTIAVLSSPWMLPIFAGAGIWYYGRKNKQLRQGMAPLMVTSLCLSGMEMQARTPGRQQTVTDEALTLWRGARTERDSKRTVAEAQKLLRNKAEATLSATRRELNDAKARMSQWSQERDRLIDEFGKEVLVAVPVVAWGGWGTALCRPGAAVQDLERALEAARRRRDERTGFFERAKAAAHYLIESAQLRLSLASARRALVDGARAPIMQLESRAYRNQEAVEQAVQSAVGQYPARAKDLLKAWLAKRGDVLEVEEEVAYLTSRETQESLQLDQATAALQQAETAQEVAERRYYGLEAV